jgi:TonB family protein
LRICNLKIGIGFTSLSTLLVVFSMTVHGADDLERRQLATLVDGTERVLAVPYASCLKVVKAELGALAQASIENIRSKSEQDQRRDRLARLSMDRPASAICLRRVALYLGAYDLKIDDLSQTAIKELSGLLVLTGEQFYSPDRVRLLTRYGKTVVEAGAREAAYLDLVDKPLEDCEAVSFEVRGLNAFLLSRIGRPSVCDVKVAAQNAVVPQPKVVTPVPVRVAPKLNPNMAQPKWEKYFPKKLMKDQNEGAVIIKACIDKTGRFESGSVQEPSGYAELDAAGLKWAKDLYYISGTVDGVPADSCFSFRVRKSFH